MISNKDSSPNEEEEDDVTGVTIQNDYGCALWIIATCVVLATCKYLGC
jgi:hypothetical protein